MGNFLALPGAQQRPSSAMKSEPVLRLPVTCLSCVPQRNARRAGGVRLIFITIHSLTGGLNMMRPYGARFWMVFKYPLESLGF